MFHNTRVTVMIQIVFIVNLPCHTNCFFFFLILIRANLVLCHYHYICYCYVVLIDVWDWMKEWIECVDSWPLFFVFCFLSLFVYICYFTLSCKIATIYIQCKSIYIPLRSPLIHSFFHLINRDNNNNFRIEISYVICYY